MPLPPTNPTGSPTEDTVGVALAAAAAGADLTTEDSIAQRTSYLTAARYVPVGAAAADPTNNRTWTVVAQTTRAITDGIVTDTTKLKGTWNVGTAYTTGDVVVLGNLMYSCISTVTGGTGPGVDTAHWTQINGLGLNYLTSLTAAFNQDDVGKTITGTGYTAATITAVQDAQTAQTTPNSAVRNALSVTIGASRTLATFTSSVASLAAGVATPLVLSGTDTKIYRDDALKVVSTHNAAGVADPGGNMTLELTAYGEGSD